MDLEGFGPEDVEDATVPLIGSEQTELERLEQDLATTPSLDEGNRLGDDPAAGPPLGYAEYSESAYRRVC